MVRKSQLRTKLAGKRVATAFAAIATTAVVGTAGIASAATLHGSSGSMTANQFCKSWQHYKFKNHGQCVSWWNHNHHGGKGHGYGGGGNGNGNTVNTGVDVNVNGNGNVVSVVINYFFGH